MAISRTARGTASYKDSTQLSFVRWTPTVGVRTYILVLAHDESDGTPISVDVLKSPSGVIASFNLDVEATGPSNQVTTSIWSVQADLDNLSGGADVGPFVTWASSTVSAGVVIEVDGLGASPFDKASTGTGSDTNPKSGATAATAQADELLVGGIGTEGPDGDAAGTWQQSFNNGQRLGTTGGGAAGNVTASEGYLVVSSTGTYEAEKTGITDRDWSACIATYKGAAAAEGPANLKTVDGLAKASIKTADGLAIGSIKTWNGLA